MLQKYLIFTFLGIMPNLLVDDHISRCTHVMVIIHIMYPKVTTFGIQVPSLASGTVQGIRRPSEGSTCSQALQLFHKVSLTVQTGGADSLYASLRRPFYTAQAQSLCLGRRYN